MLLLLIPFFKYCMFESVCCVICWSESAKKFAIDHIDATEDQICEIVQNVNQEKILCHRATFWGEIYLDHDHKNKWNWAQLSAFLMPGNTSTCCVGQID